LLSLEKIYSPNGKEGKMKTISAIIKKELLNGSPKKSKDGIENHKHAAYHHKKAAKHHRKAIKHHKAGNSDKARASTAKALTHHEKAGIAQRKDVRYHATHK
jgi:hypothetical protein